MVSPDRAKLRSELLQPSYSSLSSEARVPEIALSIVCDTLFLSVECNFREMERDIDAISSNLSDHVEVSLSVISFFNDNRYSFIVTILLSWRERSNFRDAVIILQIRVTTWRLLHRLCSCSMTKRHSRYMTILPF